MESTACDPHHDAPLPEISGVSSIASAQSESVESPENQQLRVYLRVRLLSKEELTKNEDQGCVVLESPETVLLQAPRGSGSIKSSEKNISHQRQKFTFSQIFRPGVTQADFFEGTIKTQVKELLRGKNSLVVNYGGTNSGKTHTLQGTSKDPGILPRALRAVFRRICGRQYKRADLKPYLSKDIEQLDADQLKAEESSKETLFSSLQEEPESPADDGPGNSLSTNLSPSCEHTVDRADRVDDGVPCVFSVWVAFYEIYNEKVYDLLQPSPATKTKRRPSLRVCEDGAGNPYVKDLRWVNVLSAEEASKILRVGNKNLTAAKTSQPSNRSHSIFTIKLLRISGTDVQGISEFSICDLLSPERCSKARTLSEGLREGGNGKNLLAILGKCITALRNNQGDGSKSSYVPFRESKLTWLFKGVFCGRDQASMIININPCASAYEETLNVMRFSAITKQVVQVFQPRSLESLAPRLVGRNGKPLLRNGVIDDQAVDDCLSEEELLDGEDEADVSILPQEELLSLVESLRVKLLAERRKNLVQEIEIRKEMGDIMLQQIMECEELHSRQIADLKESHEEKMTSTFEMYKEALKEHAYQCAVEEQGDDYVPVEEYTAEQERVKELQRRLVELEQDCQEPKTGSHTVLTKENAAQTSPHTPSQDSADTVRYKLLYKEKCAVEQLCGEKQELIVSLESRIRELNETLHEAGESYMEKLAEVKQLENSLAYEEQEINRIQSDVAEKEAELTALREELARLSHESVGPSRPRRGLLANIKETVTSPRNASLCRTFRKSVRATSTLRKKT